MKKLVLVFVALMLLTATAVPSFADGNPSPRGGTVCPSTGCP